VLGYQIGATVTDDARLVYPPNLQWTAEAGPGTVTFDDPNAEDVFATFSVQGQYVLKLTADDGENTVSRTVIISAGAAPEPISGDFNFDHTVDQLDYEFWKMHLGATTGMGLQSDGNGDGVVSIADYTVWRDNLGSSASVNSNGLIAGWETWSEVATDTWNATQATGVTAQAVGTPEAGGVWFSFNNATVQNGASSDGRYGESGPTEADTSVALPTDGVSLSNGFDGYIDFTLTDTTGTARALTGFHFDTGAFRQNAAIDWQLEVLPGGELTAGSLATGTATVSAGPMQDDETISLLGLADHTLDANGSVTFRLNFTGGGGDAGSPASGHHLFLDNVGVTGIALGATSVAPQSAQIISVVKDRGLLSAPNSPQLFVFAEAIAATDVAEATSISREDSAILPTEQENLLLLGQPSRRERNESHGTKDHQIRLIDEAMTEIPDSFQIRHPWRKLRSQIF
jgi:hypothetical protein